MVPTWDHSDPLRKQQQNQCKSSQKNVLFLVPPEANKGKGFQRPCIYM